MSSLEPLSEHQSTLRAPSPQPIDPRGSATAEAPVDGSSGPEPNRPALVPRLEGQGYSRSQIAIRRRWVEEKTGCELPHVGALSIPGEALRGNIENPIGAAQVPLAVAGPLALEGEHARGHFYVPLATTEGALVRSYERGMVAVTRSGGVKTRIWTDENRVSPIFELADVVAARTFAKGVEERLPKLQEITQATTSHGKLLRVECQPVGHQVIVHFAYSTGDAHGMNMIARATDAACRFLATTLGASRYLLFSGASGEKHASGALLAGGKGKKVTAGVEIPRRVVRSLLHSTPEALVELWQKTVIGHLQSGTLGYNGHFANGLTALFIACGQDVANVSNCALGITLFTAEVGGPLRASVTLPSLNVATVGGGTALGTAAECLAILGCNGSGKANKLAEITAATLLAGELSMAGALASGEFVGAHERYGRNRPSDNTPEPGSRHPERPRQLVHHGSLDV